MFSAYVLAERPGAAAHRFAHRGGVDRDRRVDRRRRCSARRAASSTLPSGGALAALVANGVATAAAFTLFFVVLDRIGPTRTGICMAFEAVTGIVLAAIFLGESVRPIVALGGAAVLAGAVLAALGVARAGRGASSDRHRRDRRDACGWYLRNERSGG